MRTDWEALPSSSPPAIRKLLRQCLAKDRLQRLSGAADARLDIGDVRAGPLDEAVSSLPPRHVPTWHCVGPADVQDSWNRDPVQVSLHRPARKRVHVRRRTGRDIIAVDEPGSRQLGNRRF